MQRPNFRFPIHEIGKPRNSLTAKRPERRAPFACNRWFTLAAIVMWLTAVSVRAAEPLHVFIRSGPKTHGPNQHDHPRFLREWKQRLAERGMMVDGGMEFPDDGQLAATDVMIVHAPDGMKIIGSQREAFEKFLARGGGVVVIHAGVVGGDQAAWVKQTLGGAWRWSSPELTRAQATKWHEGNVTLHWVSPQHPISRGLTDFQWKDEIYYDMDLSPEINVLASSDYQDRRAPQIWTYEKKARNGTTPYRAFVSLPGHEYTAFNTTGYRVVLLRGIAWAGKRAQVDEFCTSEELASLDSH